MKFNKLCFSILLLLFFGVSKAEVTSSNVDVRFRPDGPVAFKLFDNVKYDCGTPNGKWQSIVLYVPSKRAYFEGKLKVKKGDPIVDSTGRKIGYIVSDSINAMPLGSISANVFQMRFAGYVITGCARPASVIENPLAEIIMANKNDLRLNTFKKFIAEFGLKKYRTEWDKRYRQRISYVVWYDTYVDNSTTLRVELVFDYDKLIGIFHGEALKNNGFPEVKTKTNNLLWVKNNNLSEMKKTFKSWHNFYEIPHGD